jgi:hypothetical protein
LCGALLFRKAPPSRLTDLQNVILFLIRLTVGSSGTPYTSFAMFSFPREGRGKSELRDGVYAFG